MSPVFASPDGPDPLLGASCHPEDLSLHLGELLTRCERALSDLSGARDSSHLLDVVREFCVSPGEAWNRLIVLMADRGARQQAFPLLAGTASFMIGGGQSTPETLAGYFSASFLVQFESTLENLRSESLYEVKRRVSQLFSSPEEAGIVFLKDPAPVSLKLQALEDLVQWNINIGCSEDLRKIAESLPAMVSAAGEAESSSGERLQEAHSAGHVVHVQPFSPPSCASLVRYGDLDSKLHVRPEYMKIYEREAQRRPFIFADVVKVGNGFEFSFVPAHSGRVREILQRKEAVLVRLCGASTFTTEGGSEDGFWVKAPGRDPGVVRAASLSHPLQRGTPLQVIPSGEAILPDGREVVVYEVRDIIRPAPRGPRVRHRTPPSRVAL